MPTKVRGISLMNDLDRHGLRALHNAITLGNYVRMPNGTVQGNLFDGPVDTIVRALGVTTEVATAIKRRLMETGQLYCVTIHDRYGVVEELVWNVCVYY